MTRSSDFARNQMIAALFSIMCVFTIASCTPVPKSKPNIVIILTDDMGYGDLGAYGHPSIQTPNLDQMAVEGMKWSNFYSPANVCTPSRAGLLTGRLPIRSGMQGDNDRYRVLFPYSGGGLPADELTIAEFLSDQGYRTSAVGKWHLGHLPQFLPTAHGFDSYFGIPYSNDMSPTGTAPPGEVPEGLDVPEWLAPIITYVKSPAIEKWNVPLMRGDQVIEIPADQTTITRRYTEEAVQFIADNSDAPFFLFVSHNMPHVPLFAGDNFEGRSDAGLYGDVIEEIDWSVGEILKALRDHGLDERTLVVFLSDNGPWLSFGDHGGSAGPLYGGKGTTYEGGMRVPGIFWWPGRVGPADSNDVGSALDLLPTIAAVTGESLPGDRVYDGVDLSPRLFRNESIGTRTIFYYRRDELFALRRGPYKAHFASEYSYRRDNEYTRYEEPLLYNVMIDPAERFDIAAQHPDVLSEMVEAASEHRRSLDHLPPSQLNVLLNDDESDQ